MECRQGLVLCLWNGLPSSAVLSSELTYGRLETRASTLADTRPPATCPSPSCPQQQEESLRKQQMLIVLIHKMLGLFVTQQKL